MGSFDTGRFCSLGETCNELLLKRISAYSYCNVESPTKGEKNNVGRTMADRASLSQHLLCAYSQTLASNLC